ncbi:MAG: hydrogenase nickel incorporation protein HypB [Candidatus Edwardsbacteria bacterium]
MEVKVLKNILEVNKLLAQENRQLFDKEKVFVVNLMSSPGAGKTSLVERTLERLIEEDYRIAVIEGDIVGDFDAQRLAKFNIPIVQINTGSECHLDANMIRNALSEIDLKGIDLLLIENVGNLVCPAEFKVGENVKVVILSTPEGDDKPHKYPLMFRESKVLLINKIDLLPQLEFAKEKVRKAIADLNPQMTIFEISCKTQEGLENWIDWLKKQIEVCGNS